MCRSRVPANLVKHHSTRKEAPPTKELGLKQDTVERQSYLHNKSQYNKRVTMERSRRSWRKPIVGVRAAMILANMKCGIKLVTGNAESYQRHSWQDRRQDLQTYWLQEILEGTGRQIQI